MTAELKRIGSADIEAFWGDVLEPMFASVGDRVLSDRTPEDIRAMALSGERVIWAVVDEERPDPLMAVFTAFIRDCGGTKVLHVEDMAGAGMSDWLPLLAELEKRAAAEAGATLSHIEGRIGWQRALAPLGYRPVRVVVEKEI